METIDTFYKQLNESQELEDSFKFFESYRREVSVWLKELIQKEKIVDMTVFGAGNLMDVDYKMLLNNSSVETCCISDIDMKAMDKGMKFQKLTKEKMKTVAFDYLMIKDKEKALLEWIKRLKGINESTSSLDLEKIVGTFVDPIIEELLNSHYQKFLENQQDMILVLPIYTQILFLEVSEISKGLSGFKYIQPFLFQKMIYIIDAFNRKMLELLKTKAIMVVLSDIMEVKERVVNIKKEIEAYEKTYGVGLGSYGLLNMSEYGRVLEERYFCWQFSKNRYFLVKGLLLSH